LLLPVKTKKGRLAPEEGFTAPFDFAICIFLRNSRVSAALTEMKLTAIFVLLAGVLMREILEHSFHSFVAEGPCYDAYEGMEVAMLRSLQISMARGEYGSIENGMT
jgi:hypothetical protein